MHAARSVHLAISNGCRAAGRVVGAGSAGSADRRSGVAAGVLPCRCGGSPPEAFDGHCAIGASFAHDTGVSDHAAEAAGGSSPTVLRDGAAKAVSPHASGPAAILQFREADAGAADVEREVVAELANAPEAREGVERSEVAELILGVSQLVEWQCAREFVAEVGQGVAGELRKLGLCLGQFLQRQVPQDLIAQWLHRVAREPLEGRDGLVLVGGWDVLHAIRGDPKLHAFPCLDLHAAIGVLGDRWARSAATRASTTAAAAAACCCLTRVAGFAARAPMSWGMTVCRSGKCTCHGKPRSRARLVALLRSVHRERNRGAHVRSIRDGCGGAKAEKEGKGPRVASPRCTASTLVMRWRARGTQSARLLRIIVA